MEYIWISCCQNEEENVVPDPRLLEAIQAFTPFPSLNGRTHRIMEAFFKDVSFVLEVKETCIGNSAKYYSKAALKWNMPGHASWDSLAHVCVTQEESDDDIVIGHYRKFAITKEMRQAQAYEKLINVLSSRELMDSWIRDNCSDGVIRKDWECEPV